jgi:hypothetical protein
VTFGKVLLAAYRGDRQQASGLLGAVSEETSGSGDPTIRSWFRRVEAVVALMAGDVAGAYDEAMASIAAEPEGPNAVIAVATAGHAALWLRDASKARAVLESTEPDEIGWTLATRRAIEAGIMALDGQTREAYANFENVLAGRLAVGDRFSHAFMTADAVAVLPEGEVPEGAVDTARTCLEEIGATPLLVRLKGPPVPAATEA